MNILRKHEKKRPAGVEPEAAIFMSVFFIEISLITIGTEQDVRHPVRRSAHLFTDHIQVNIRYLLHNIITKSEKVLHIYTSIHGCSDRRVQPGGSTGKAL